MFVNLVRGAFPESLHVPGRFVFDLAHFVGASVSHPNAVFSDALDGFVAATAQALAFARIRIANPLQVALISLQLLRLVPLDVLEQFDGHK